MSKPIILLGEAKGENEAKINSSFVGASGIELLKMLHESSLLELTSADLDYLNKYYNTTDPQMIEMIWRLHPKFYRTNVFQFHPPGNRIESVCGTKAEALRGFPALIKGRFVRAEYKAELERLGDEILSIDPHLIIALGNTPLWALSGRTGVSKLRGTTAVSTNTVSGYKFLSTYHPAAVLRQWELRPTTVIDLMKAKREAEFPEVRRPKREIWIEPTLGDLENFYERYLLNGCSGLAVDIETSGNQITCIGFAPSSEVSLVLPFVDARRKGRNYWADQHYERSAWLFVKRILDDRSIRKVFQNGAYDIAFLWRSMGLKVFGAEHDTMLLHHALQPESLKSLGFLGSIYSDERSWKGMRKNVTTIKGDE